MVVTVCMLEGIRTTERLTLNVMPSNVLADKPNVAKQPAPQI